jgi:hypothetical protein
MSDLKIEPIYSGGVVIGYDAVLTNGRLELVDGIDEIKNRLLIGTQVYTGENYTDQEYGVDYFNNVFGRSIDDPVLIDTLKAAILSTRGVFNIETFNIELDSNRTAVLTSHVNTTEGEIELVTPIQT